MSKNNTTIDKTIKIKNKILKIKLMMVDPKDQLPEGKIPDIYR